MIRFTMILVLLACLLMGFAFREEKGTIVIDRDTSTVIGGNNRFALDLYAKIRTRPGNVAVSPASLSHALAMTYEGARGETAREMAEVCRFPDDREAMRRGFRALNARMNGDGSPRPYRLAAVNALWAQTKDGFRPTYIATLADDYGASIHEVDFRGAPEPSRLAINAWVDDRTNHLVPDLLAPALIGRDTALVLVNAVHYKADWATPFPATATSPADFHAGPGRTVSVPMMRRTDDCRYAERDGVQVLELPYKGGDHAMLVVLPRAADGLPAFEASLSTEALGGWLAGLSTARVAVELPRFKVSDGVELAGTLAGMGMPRAFEGSADFSGMDGSRGLAISAVAHRAVVAVDEEGTEAAAATGVVMSRGKGLLPPATSFRADRPFLYLIRDVKTGAVLFLGRVVDPSR